LILAAGFNMIAVVNELINGGSAIDRSNRYGHTAFTWACLCGHGEMVRSLLLQVILLLPLLLTIINNNKIIY
jgi:ankyrin repeat protein